MFTAAFPIQREQVVGGPRDRDAALALGVVAGRDWEHAYSAQPVLRMMRYAVVDSEPGLGERFGHIARERRVRIVRTQGIAQTVGQARASVG